MKKSTVYITLITLVALICVFSAIEIFKAPKAQGTDIISTDKNKLGNNKVISVIGQSRIFVQPDIAYISFGVQTEDKVAKTAQIDNSEKMDKVISSLKSMGIKDEDIQTNNYNIYPKERYDQNGKAHVDGYIVINEVLVIIRNIEKVGETIDVVAKAGVNRAGSIQFGLADQQKSYDEALAKAVEEAKGKAESVAGAAGVKIKDMLYISEVTEKEGIVIDGYMKEEAVQLADEAVQTPIQPGQLEVSAKVNVVYSY
ncbi:MAG: SIMPL domain-containing protein [Clostridia bacterium]|nr:SIMPL domain-containing protein [Clostridia bacterium]